MGEKSSGSCFRPLLVGVLPFRPRPFSPMTTRDVGSVPLGVHVNPDTVGSTHYGTYFHTGEVGLLDRHPRLPCSSGPMVLSWCQSSAPPTPSGPHGSTRGRRPRSLPGSTGPKLKTSYHSSGAYNPTVSSRRVPLQTPLLPRRPDPKED